MQEFVNSTKHRESDDEDEDEDEHAPKRQADPPAEAPPQPEAQVEAQPLHAEIASPTARLEAEARARLLGSGSQSTTPTSEREARVLIEISRIQNLTCPYDILGLYEDFFRKPDLNVLNSHYKKIVRILHPDKTQHPSAPMALAKVESAHARLMKLHFPSAPHQYDESWRK